MKPQFVSRQRRQPPETHRGAGTVRRATSAPQIFRRVLRLPLLPRELRRYDTLDAKLQPLMLATMAQLRSLNRVPENFLSHSRSPRCLELCDLKRCVPSRGEWLLQAENRQNCDASTAQSNP